MLIQTENVEFFFGVNNGYSISRSWKETNLTPHKNWLRGPPIPLCNDISGLYHRNKVAWSGNWKINLVHYSGSEVVLLGFQYYVHRQDWCLKAHGQHKNIDIVVGRVTMFKVGWPRDSVTNPSRVKRIFFYPRYPHRLWGTFKFLFNVYRGPLRRGKSGRIVKLKNQFSLSQIFGSLVVNFPVLRTPSRLVFKSTRQHKNLDSVVGRVTMF